MNRLSYLSDDDRSYGAAGMAIGLVAFDGEEYMVSLSIDREPGEMMEMMPDFYFSGNPEFSAKSAWNRIIHHYNLQVVMLLGNILCRNMIQNRLTVGSDLHEEIRRAVAEEGLNSCGLEADETDRLFQKDFNYLNRLFSHPGVKNVAHGFASAISSRRSLSRMEILDYLQSLNMI